MHYYIPILPISPTPTNILRGCKLILVKTSLPLKRRNIVSVWGVGYPLGLATGLAIGLIYSRKLKP